MRSLTLATQVVVLLAAGLVLMGVTAVAGYRSSESLGKVVGLYRSEKLPALQALAALGISVAEAAGRAAGLENGDAPEAAHRKDEAALKVVVAEGLENAKAYGAVPKDDEEQRAWESTTGHLQDWVDAIAKLEAASEERAKHGDDFAKAAAAQHDVSAAFDGVRDQTQRMVVDLQGAGSPGPGLGSGPQHRRHANATRREPGHPPRLRRRRPGARGGRLPGRPHDAADRATAQG